MVDKCKIKVEFEVSADRICSLLVGVFDLGASNYWMHDYDFIKADKPDWSWCESEENLREWSEVSKVYTAVMCGGHYDVVLLNDNEDGPGETVRVFKKDLLEGLRIMAAKFPKHFQDIVNENDDAETSDVYFQCCVLKDVVYG